MVVVLLKKKVLQKRGSARYLCRNGEIGGKWGKVLARPGACHFALPATTCWRAERKKTVSNNCCDSTTTTITRITLPPLLERYYTVNTARRDTRRHYHASSALHSPAFYHCNLDNNSSIHTHHTHSRPPRHL